MLANGRFTGLELRWFATDFPSAIALSFACGLSGIVGIPGSWKTVC